MQDRGGHYHAPLSEKSARRLWKQGEVANKRVSVASLTGKKKLKNVVMEKKDNVAAPSSHAGAQDIVYQLARDLLRAPDVQTIADHLFARARNFLSAGHGFVGLVNIDGTELHGVASYGLSLDMIRQERMRISSETVRLHSPFSQISAPTYSS